MPSAESLRALGPRPQGQGYLRFNNWPIDSHLFAANRAYPGSEGERAVFVNKSPVGPITQPARLASDQGDELG